MKEDGTVKVYVEKTTLKDSLPHDMYTSFLSNKRRIEIYLKEHNMCMGVRILFDIGNGSSNRQSPLEIQCNISNVIVTYYKVNT